MSQFEPPKPAINFPNGIQHKEHPVTNHMQNAIEAGAKAMAPVNGNTRNFHLFPDGWLAESKAALDAMLPHIREMIAQEILEAHYDRSPNYGYSARDISVAQEAVRDAARIAKGPQQ